MIDVKIKRLKTSRSLRLRVFEDGTVVVTAPTRVPQRLIDEFIDQHRDWITQKRTEASSKQERLTAERDKLFFRGTEYGFRLNVSATKKSGVVVKDDQILVTCPAEDHAVVRPILEKWYRAQGAKRFTERVPLLADLVGRDVKNVTIRDQRTRWGSCSSRNTISLNWRLIMAPDTVSDYVIYHELAHLTHMNHSDRFWNLVEQYVPNYKEAETWLKTHQKLLRF